MTLPVIVVTGLGKCYRLNGGPFWALRDISMEVHAGEVVGIIGRNGAGKTTLLRLLSRITDPTEGRARIRGRVGSLLETGTGFHDELSGRENIFMNGAILGMRREEIRRKFDEIVEFSGVGSFIDVRIKNYSSGMRTRLAFSVAAHLDTEVLLVDEVLAVGDISFQEKCIKKMEQLTSSSGRAVLFVTHNMGAVLQLCSRGIVLEKGTILAQGGPTLVVKRYYELMSGQSEQKIDLSRSQGRPGTHSMRFTGCWLEDLAGNPLTEVPAGTGVRIVLEYERHTDEPVNDVMINISFLGAKGNRLLGSPSDAVSCSLLPFPSRGRFVCTIPRLCLLPGYYELVIGCKVNRQLVDKLVNLFGVAVSPSDFYGTGRLPQPFYGETFTDYGWEVVPALPAEPPRSPAAIEARTK